MDLFTLPPASTLEGFPNRWQDACRSVLRLYCELPENRRGEKPMGMTRLRNILMKEFDTWDGKSRVDNKSLGREDLEHWMKGTYLSVTKFQYVDYWIRTHRNDPLVSRVLDDIIDYKEQLYRELFSELYTSRYNAHVNDIVEILRDIKGSIFLSEIIKIPKISDNIRDQLKIGGYRQIAILFRDHNYSSSSVTVIYFDTPASELRPSPDRRDWVVCFGYLTVTAKSNEMWPTIHGPVHVFRDRLRGHNMAGTSISEFQLDLNDFELQTHWYPQIASQTSMGGHEVDIANPDLPQSEDEKDWSKKGIRRFKKPNKTDNYLLNSIINLKNRYLVW